MPETRANLERRISEIVKARELRDATIARVAGDPDLTARAKAERIAAFRAEADPALAAAVAEFESQKAEALAGAQRRSLTRPPLPTETGARTAALLERMAGSLRRLELRAAYDARAGSLHLADLAGPAKEALLSSDTELAEVLLEAAARVLPGEAGRVPTVPEREASDALRELRALVAEAKTTAEQKAAREEAGKLEALALPREVDEADLRMRFRLGDPPGIAEPEPMVDLGGGLRVSAAALAAARPH